MASGHGVCHGPDLAADGSIRPSMAKRRGIEREGMEIGGRLGRLMVGTRMREGVEMNGERVQLSSGVVG